MSLPAKRLDRDRVDFSNHITEKEVEQLVSDPDIRTLQCSSPVELDTWDLLNRKLFSQRPEIELRVYGFYSRVCDLSFVSRVGSVRRFAADCLRQATGVEHISQLERLEELSIGIYSLDSFDFLMQSALVTSNVRSVFCGLSPFPLRNPLPLFAFFAFISFLPTMSREASRFMPFSSFQA